MKPLTALMTVSLGLLLASAFASPSEAHDSSARNEISESQVKEGYAISPIPKEQLNLRGKNRDMVGIGSYLVNGASDCSGCHSFPEFLPDKSMSDGGDPFTGLSSDQSSDGPLLANYDTADYLAGGQCFGPFMARNIAPDSNGLPAHLSLDDFMTVMRTGADLSCKNEPSDPICAIEPSAPVLQVMPWPAFHNLTDHDLEAIYAYLSALPSATPCNTPADGCPGFSGLATDSSSYVYAATADCPNPAPPQ